METLLNLLWLFVALVAVWLWRFRWLASRQNPPARVFMEAVAIACVLSLLLPVISLTDDLHPEIVAVDAASGKRNSHLLIAGTMSTCHATPISGAQSIVATLLSRSAQFELCVAGIVLPTENLHPLALRGSYRGRSPPSLL